MTAESPTPSSSNAPAKKELIHCADRRCHCVVELEGTFCEPACEKESTATNYCQCTHAEDCGSPLCARKGCGCSVKEKGLYCSDDCKARPKETKRCSCEHDSCSYCARRVCNCPVAKVGLYCSKACENQPEQTKHCPCLDENCYRECDLVMKGGITSGIVYPPLVYKLYESNYRFRCIGGTSAGAIAAVVTAAAEYGRSNKGFEKLKKVQDQLGEGTFLRDLFQPMKETRPLFDFLLRSLELAKSKDDPCKKDDPQKEKWFWRKMQQVRRKLEKRWPTLVKVKKAWQGVRELERTSPARFFLFFLGGALLALALALLIGWVLKAPLTGKAFVILVVVWLIGASLGYVCALAENLWRFYKILTVKVPENNFGMCTGMPDKDASGSGSARVLTEWFNEQINLIADIARPEDNGKISTPANPLTFGMLKKAKLDKPPLHGEEGIQLRMVTSNLSQNQPYILPLKDHLFIFRESEFEKFFPKEIVKYMRKVAEKEVEDYKKSKQDKDSSGQQSQKIKGRGNYTLPKGYYFLPEADDLPVIVAMRLSLSFPLLLSALPMYTIIPKKVEEAKGQKEVTLTPDHLKKNWFSDGGIASNFPIQFFDTWLPTRPTFGVNLTSLPKESFLPSKKETNGEDGKNETVKIDCNSPTLNPDSQSGQAMLRGENATDPEENMRKPIYLPKANDPLYTEWVDLREKTGSATTAKPDLLKFLWACFTTAQNYRDNMQATLPSYRERIVQIRLSKEEGGLNLAMGKDMIKIVMNKGIEAGNLLTNFDFKVHQWVRFRLLMSQMEQYMGKTYEVARKKSEDSDKRLFDYPQLIKQAKRDDTYPFRPREKREGENEEDEKEWGEVAQKRMELMGEFISKWEKDKPKLSEDPPLPESVLRIMPEL